MGGTSDGLRKAWKKRRAEYGASGYTPAVKAAKAAGTFEKRTVTILDKPFRLSGLTASILAHWKREYLVTGQRADRLIEHWLRHGDSMSRKDLSLNTAQTRALLRHQRQYRRAIATGTRHLENKQKVRR